jgi:lipid A 3-O-deacylase
MIMRKIVALVTMLLICGVLHTGAMAGEPSGYGISFGYGQADPDIDIYRLGLKKDFDGQWLKTGLGYFSGFYELSFNRWEHKSKDINGAAFSPVFAYYFGDRANFIKPYIEGGIGVTYIDGYHIADRNLSTNFQFKDRIGAGMRIGFFDLNFSYMHYSNASIKEPNHGIDILIFTTSVQF